MNTRPKWLILFSLLIIASLVLAACQPAATPTPERIVETVVVTQVIEGEVQEVIITATPAPETPAPEVSEGPIMADGLVACLPLPEVAYGTGGARTASLAQTEPASLVTRPASAAQAGIRQQITPSGDYIVGTFEDVTTINYWAANGPDNTVYNSYMLPAKGSLYTLSGKYFTLIPDLAADVQPPALQQEGEEWVAEVALRQDVTWSDGEPFTAEDVAFTAQTVKDFNLISGNWSSWYDFNYLDRIEAADDFTVRLVFHTKAGTARFEYGVLQAPILAEHYWGPVVEQARAPLDALGADPSDEDLVAAQAQAQDVLFAHESSDEPDLGPFLLSNWEPGASLELVANPDYYQAGVTVEQWPDAAYRDSEGIVIGEPSGDPETVYTYGPYVEAVVYSIYGSQDTAILALRQGDVDFVLNSLGLQRGLADQIRADANLTVLENPTNGFRYMGFNMRRMPMNDCSFRQAVAVLIDKEFVSNTILQGVAYPLYAFIPEGNAAWFSDEAPQIGRGLTREQRTNLAVQILQNAGYSWENDQVPTWSTEGGGQVVPGGQLIMPNGQPVPPLNMPAPSAGYDPLRSTFAIWIETWLNEFGIPLNAQLAGFNVIVPQIFTEQNFDMWILGWSLGLFPDYLFDFFAEEQAVLDGNNAGGYVNPEFEALGRGILECEGIEACKEIADEMQVMLGTEVPYVLLFDTGIIEAYRSASIEFPWEEQLSGLQYSHQTGQPLQALVQLR
jgi:peptide/nickel transport system substrate-binding protein